MEMQSSPPLHPEDAQSLPHSPARSEYSVDLNAMTQDSEDAQQSPMPTRKIEEVRSEDIDGPSDFTLNMEAYMRGMNKQKGTLKSVRAGTLARGSVRHMFSQAVSQQIQEQDEENQAQTAEDDKPEMETPLGARDSSVWDAYNNPSPSPSPKQADRRPLQPTVEDYDSELSPAPARPMSAPTLPPPTHEPSRLSNVLFPASRDNAVNNEDSQLDDLRKQLAELRILHEKTELKAQHFEEQLRSAEDARQALRIQLDTTTAALEAANNDRAYATDADRLVKTDEALHTTRTDLESAQRALGRAQSEADELKTQLEEIRESEDAELQDLRMKLRDRQAVETELKAQAEDLKAKLLAAVEEGTKAKEERTRTCRADSITSSTSASAEMEKLRAELVTARAETDRLRLELASTAHPPASGDLASAQQEIAHLREELDLLQDLTRLDEDTAEVRHPARAADDGAEEKIRAAEEKRVTAEEGLRTSEKQRLELHSLLEGARTELESLRAANSALDEEVSSAIKRREEHWAAREREWLKERKLMAKALLRQWGREEIAIDDREQRYRYMYNGVRMES